MAITPNGEVYFPLQNYEPDFSTNISSAAWLIHGLTHSWQHQEKMWVRLRAILNRNYHYGDPQRSKLSFYDYGIEQFAIAMFGSLLTALYWWIVFTIVYASVLFAGDRNPARPPLPDGEVLLRSGATIVVGGMIYAVLSVLWQRMTARLKRP